MREKKVRFTLKPLQWTVTANHGWCSNPPEMRKKQERQTLALYNANFNDNNSAKNNDKMFYIFDLLGWRLSHSMAHKHSQSPPINQKYEIKIGSPFFCMSDIPWKNAIFANFVVVASQPFFPFQIVLQCSSTENVSVFSPTILLEVFFLSLIIPSYSFFHARCYFNATAADSFFTRQILCKAITFTLFFHRVIFFFFFVFCCTAVVVVVDLSCFSEEFDFVRKRRRKKAKCKITKMYLERIVNAVKVPSKGT